MNGVPNPSRGPLMRRPWLIFIATYATLHLGYIGLCRLDAGQAAIDAMTVRPAALWLAWAGQPVGAVDSWLTWPGGRLRLRNGCDGIDMMMLFAAASGIAPLPLRGRVWLLGAGVLLLWAANQARVVALYATFRHDRAWFDAVHGLWGPLLLVAVGCAVYAAALGMAKPRP